MAEHEPSIGASDDWYTPPAIFEALGLQFDLDPCSPGPAHWVPARRVYTAQEDGLSRPWSGLVFMNPPFGGRHGHLPWLLRFLAHKNGVAIVRAYTSSGWFHDFAPKADAWLFPRGKTRFVPSPDLRAELERKARERGGTWHDAPGHGVILLGMGDVAVTALARSGLGIFVDRRAALTPTGGADDA